MNRRIVLLAAMIPLMAATFARGAGSYIVGSAHDFSSMAWSGGEICKPCHTPHNALPAEIAGERLWNHALTNATYQLHGHNGTPTSGTAADSLDKPSRLCMSCHDGTVALDSFGGMTGTSFIPGGNNLGLDLRDDHPVGAYVVYKDETGRVKPIDQVKTFGLRFSNLGTTRTITNTDGTTTTKANEAVGCSTCHTAHGAGYPSLLRKSNAASAVCLACHYK